MTVDLPLCSRGISIQLSVDDTTQLLYSPALNHVVISPDSNIEKVRIHLLGLVQQAQQLARTTVGRSLRLLVDELTQTLDALVDETLSEADAADRLTKYYTIYTQLNKQWRNLVRALGDQTLAYWSSQEDNNPKGDLDIPHRYPGLGANQQQPEQPLRGLFEYLFAKYPAKVAEVSALVTLDPPYFETIATAGEITPVQEFSTQKRLQRIVAALDEIPIAPQTATPLAVATRLRDALDEPTNEKGTTIADATFVPEEDTPIVEHIPLLEAPYPPGDGPMTPLSDVSSLPALVYALCDAGISVVLYPEQDDSARIRQFINPVLQTDTEEGLTKIWERTALTVHILAVLDSQGTSATHPDHGRLACPICPLRPHPSETGPKCAHSHFLSKIREYRNLIVSAF